jgi:hypothetical protein
VHEWNVTGKRGGSRAATSPQLFLQRQPDEWRSVHCQRFFYSERHTSYFVVLNDNQAEWSDSSQSESVGAGSIAASVLQDLVILERVQEERANVVCEETSAN